MKITFNGTYDECLEQAHRFVESARELDAAIRVANNLSESHV